MPPRRSSRALSASLEPQAAETQPNKRKRGQKVDADAEQEPPVKLPSKARRPSSNRGSVPPAAPSRKASRVKSSLPDLPESEKEEETDSAPPMKKPRPSAENDQESSRLGEDDEEREDPPPKIGRRAPSVPKGSAKPPTRRASGRKTPTASSSRISSGSTGSAIPEEPEVDEDEDLAPAKGRRIASKGKSRAPTMEDDEGSAPEEEDDDEEAKPTVRGRVKKGKAPMARKASGKPVPKPAAKALTPEEESDAGMDSDDFVPPASPVKPQRAPSPEEEEEEKSLFEPRPVASQPSVKPTVIPEEPKGPQARLVIDKIALVNFKSYAGRQVIGPFHKSFSAIVGPNGSGKSNTIDALLFVFGYRASKMRQGKLSELIHNSANYPDLRECSVEIHFKQIIDIPGSEKYETVPNSDLAVARIAYKNNTSRYTINGRNAALNEVQTLLNGLGIDLTHNRFLILQGEVESIAQMKPKAPSEHEEGLLEYLEDIIGTAHYKTPIEEALTEMDRLGEERQIKLNRLRLVEKEKEALEAEKKEAEKFLKLKNHHARAVSRLYQYRIYAWFKEEGRLEAKIADLTEALAQKKEENKGNLEDLEAQRGQYTEREALYEQVRTEAAKAAKDMSIAEKREISLQEKRKHVTGKLNKLKKALAEDTKAQKTAKHTIQDSEEKIESEKAKLDDYEASLEQEEAVLDQIQESLKDKTQGINTQIQARQQELVPWTAKINKKQAEIDVASSERAALKKKAEDLATQAQEATETYQTLNTEYQEKIDEQKELRAEKSQLQQTIAATNKRVQAARENHQSWKNKAAASRSKVDEAKANQSENRSRNNVLDSLTRLRDAGNNEGFYGRLGALGTIPDKYDVAISTACGGGLAMMVVDKVHQAQHCIEYLRKNNVGRASFMVLEKITHGVPQKVNTPENVPRLFDLVKPKDPKFAPAFYKAIGDTLVATDMEQANRIAFGGPRRYRVVTLDGGLIETSGAMSGGGTQTSRGAMSSKLAADSISPQLLQSYERDSEQAAQMLQKATAELQQAEAELEGLNKRGPEIDLQSQKLGLEVDTIKRRILEAEKRVKDLKSQNKPDAGDLARISKLDKEIDTATSELDKLTEKADKIGAEIQALEKKIIEIGGSKLLLQKSKVDGIRTQINICNENITRAEVALEKAKKDLVKYSNSIESNQVAAEEAEEELQGLDGQLEEVVQYLDKVRTRVEEAQHMVEVQKEDLDQLKQELEVLEEAVKDFLVFETKTQREIAESKNEMKKLAEAIEMTDKEHEKLTLEDIDDDEDDEDGGDEEANAEPTEDGQDRSVKQEAGMNEEPPAHHTEKTKRFKVYSDKELATMNADALTADALYADDQVKKANPDLSVLKEYRKREEEFMNRTKDYEDVCAQREAQKQTWENLCKQRRDEFMAGFNSISLKLKEMYQMITLGGNAELELVDSMDPFSEGIIFSVMPPKKSWKNIANLSGGEKTLSSLALVFALHVYKPTPLYFMDEIDAALDFRNVSIVANYIKDRTKNAQFIIISLRNDMFELSNRLIGIYKTSNQTRSIAIDNHALLAAVPKVVPLMPTQPVNDPTAAEDTSIHA